MPNSSETVERNASGSEVVEARGFWGASRAHLSEAEMGYWSHLTHAFHQSNRLILVALKSYIHGVFPLWFKSDGPKTIIRMYHEIRRIRHIDALARSMEDGEPT